MSLRLGNNLKWGGGVGSKQMAKITIVFNFPSPQPKLGKSGYGRLMVALGFFHSYLTWVSLLWGRQMLWETQHTDTFLIWGNHVMCVSP